MHITATLGADFCRQNKCVVDFMNNTLYVSRKNITVTLKHSLPATHNTVPISLVSAVTIPPYSEMEVCLKMRSDSFLGDWLLEPDPAPAMAALSLVRPSQQGFVYSSLLNPQNETVILKQGT